MELAEHSVIGHGISVNVGAQPGTFAWTRGRDGWKDRPTTLVTVEAARMVNPTRRAGFRPTTRCR